MFDHVCLKVQNFSASLGFYKDALSPLGFELRSRDDTSAGFGAVGKVAHWLESSGVQGGSAVHIALRATNRNAVNGFYARGMSAGGWDNGKPGVHDEYGANYYAAFLIDPDGNNVKLSVCRRH